MNHQSQNQLNFLGMFQEFGLIEPLIAFHELYYEKKLLLDHIHQLNGFFYVSRNLFST